MATRAKPTAEATKAAPVKRKAGRPPAGRSVAMRKSKEAAGRILEKGSLVGDWPPKDSVMPTLPDAATPLDVMIEAMRRAYSLGGPIAAFPYAKEAAPFLHAKISSIELKQPPPPGTGVPGSRFIVEFVRPKPTEDDAGGDDGDN